MRMLHLPGPAQTWTAAARALVVAGSLAAVACSGAHEPAERSSQGLRRPQLIRPTANVPALLGYSIEGLRQRLGAGRDLEGLLTDAACLTELAPRATDSLLAFRTGGLLLVASYDIRSRRLNDLFLLGRHEDSLMQRAALRADAPNYLVLPAFEHDRPGQLLGLRVIPAQRQ